MLLSDIRVGDIEDLIQDLKAKGRKPATVNRYLALLRHMMNWAVGREHLTQTPFRRGSQALIKFEREDNRRIKRVSPDEEQALLNAASPLTQMMIIAAVDTGLRRAELLNLACGDVDQTQQVLHVRSVNAKSGKARIVPIGTQRLRGIVEWLLSDATRQRRPDDAPLFSRGGDLSIKSFRTAWENARNRAKVPDIRFHDLRSEYASRLVEHGVPLSQVRDLLGHSSIMTTERYDRQRLDSLKQAVQKLERGQTFKNLSSSGQDSRPIESVSPTH